jgi:hypothetical protein
MTDTMTSQTIDLSSWDTLYSPLLLGYKPVQRVTVLNTVGSCSTVVSGTSII